MFAATSCVLKCCSQRSFQSRNDHCIIISSNIINFNLDPTGIWYHSIIHIFYHSYIRLYDPNMTSRFLALQASSKVDDTVSYEMLKKYVDLGGVQVDTARIYSAGETENILGRILPKSEFSTKKLVLGTKVHPSQADGLSEKGIRGQLEASPKSHECFQCWHFVFASTWSRTWSSRILAVCAHLDARRSCWKVWDEQLQCSGGGEVL